MSVFWGRVGNLMYNFLRSTAALPVLSALLLVLLPACIGGSGGSSSGRTGGGATGNSTNPFLPTDLSGDWTGHLTPRDNEGLPWADGDLRILSRNFFLRADGQGNFTYCQPGTENPYDVASGGASLNQTVIGHKGLFSAAFRELEKNREQLILVGRLNDARNFIHGEYELRSRTVNTEGQDVEAVDSGVFELTLSAGLGNFQPSIFEGSWNGHNYHYAPRYSNMTLEIDANGSVIGGGIDTGDQVYRWDTEGANDLVFDRFTDSSVGMLESFDLMLDHGAPMFMHYVMVDESGTFLTGPIEDTQGNITYFRLKKE